MIVACKILVSLIFVGFAGYEVYERLIEGEPWFGYTERSSYVIYLLAVIWIAGAIAVWKRNYFAKVAAGGAVAASLVHGILVRIGEDSTGGVFMIAAIVAGALLGAIIHSELFPVVVSERPSHTQPEDKFKIAS